MSTHTERINAIRLDVTVPGAEIRAELAHRNQVTVTFGRGRYEYMSERDLEHYLAALARLLYAAWVRAYRATVSDRILASYDEESWIDREYKADRDNLTSRGASSDGRIGMTARGMREIDVTIAAGTIRALNEHEFSAATREAVTALIADHLEQIEVLKDRYYG